MISNTMVQDIARILLVFCVISVSAKSIHYGDSNQINPDQEASLLDTANSGLTPLQLEFLAQRLAEYNQVQQIPAVGWERFMKNPEIIKRQSRYRQCYFNPISCFKK